MEFPDIGRIFLLVLSAVAFVYVTINLKRAVIPFLVAIGASFALFLLDLAFHFSRTTLQPPAIPPAESVTELTALASYLSQLIGVFLLAYGFFRASRTIFRISPEESVDDGYRIVSSALAESEKRYREFFEEDLSGNFILTPSGTILACNPAFAHMFGYNAAADIISTDGSALFESQRSFENVIELIQRHRRLNAYQMTMKRNDESRVYVVANMNGEFDEDDQLLQIQGFVLDETERVKVEQTLRNSVEQFRQVFEKGPIGMMLVTLEGDIIKVNTAFCAMVGYSEGELRKITIDGITHAEDVGRDSERQAMLAAGEIASYRTEKRFLTQKGDVIWGLMTVSVVREADGAALYGVRIVEDITARKRGEEEVERSLSVLKATLEATTDGILVVDQNRRVVNYNQRFVEMWKIPAPLLADPVESSIVEIIFEQLENRDRYQAILERAYQEPDVENYDILRFLDGRVVELYSRPQRISGKTFGRVWSFRDVTVRVRSEDERRASEEKYRALFEESKDVVFISTPNGRFLDINSAGVELFGYSSKEELLQVDIAHDLYVDAKERERATRILAEKGFLKDHLTRAKCKNGQIIIVLETTTAVRDHIGNVVTYRGILRDITEQHRLEEQLRQAQRLESVGTLAGGIAHDFNNILSIALGYLARLDVQDDNPEIRTRTIDSIRKALGRGAGLVQQLLTFARKTSGVSEAVHVNEVLEDLTTLLAETFPASIRFDLRFAPGLPLLLADQGQFQQAVMNLCINSRDAMMEPNHQGSTGGTITVSTALVSGSELRERFAAASHDQYILVRVHDTGIGMDEETKRRIFEPFFTTKPPGKGTGIGLSVVYGIVDSHKGFIDVEAIPGGGATITLHFPVLPVVEPEAPVGEAPEPRRGDGETILIVEDEEMLLDLLKLFLEENGYRVLTARDGLEAVEIYKQHAAEISVVLSDMGLPKLGGWEAFRRMKQVNPSVCCILASGFFDPDIRTDMIREGALDFVQKPYVPTVILGHISEAIRLQGKGLTPS